MTFKFGEPRLIKEWLKDYKMKKLIVGLDEKQSDFPDHVYEDDRSKQMKEKDVKSTVEAITLSKSKKAYRVMLLGKWYGMAKDDGQDLEKGMTISANIEDSDYGPWLNDVVMIGAAPLPIDIRDPGQSHRSNGDRFYMPFVSNCVAHAIAAGLIKDYPAISQWAKAARDAAVALDMLDEPGTDG